MLWGDIKGLLFYGVVEKVCYSTARDRSFIVMQSRPITRHFIARFKFSCILLSNRVIPGQVQFSRHHVYPFQIKLVTKVHRQVLDWIIFEHEMI